MLTQAGCPRRASGAAVAAWRPQCSKQQFTAPQIASRAWSAFSTDPHEVGERSPTRSVRQEPDRVKRSWRIGPSRRGRDARTARHLRGRIRCLTWPGSSQVEDGSAGARTRPGPRRRRPAGSRRRRTPGAVGSTARRTSSHKQPSPHKVGERSPSSRCRGRRSSQGGDCRPQCSPCGACRWRIECALWRCIAVATFYR